MLKGVRARVRVTTILGDQVINNQSQIFSIMVTKVMCVKYQIQIHKVENSWQGRVRVRVRFRERWGRVARNERRERRKKERYSKAVDTPGHIG